MIAVDRLYQHTGDPDHLETAIEIGQTLVERTAHGPARAMYLHGLGNALLDRYHLSNDPADLDEAITAHEQAVAGTPSDSPDRPPYLDDWATALLYRYRTTHDVRDLTRVLGTREDLVRLIPASSPDLVKYLNNLGLALLARPGLTSTGKPKLTSAKRTGVPALSGFRR